jgi:TPR repeat protein
MIVQKMIYKNIKAIYLLLRVMVLFLVAQDVFANKDCHPNEFDEVLSKAKQGSSVYQDRLGIMYTRGCSVNSDESKAVYWYKKAGLQGSSDAQYALFLDYGSGIGVPTNYFLEKYWLMKAATNKNSQAQEDLAGCYQGGDCQLINKNFNKAVYWYQKAAMQKNTSAMFTLGASYMYGTMGCKNHIKAYVWLNILRTLDPGGYNPIKKLTMQMTSKELSIAQMESDDLFSNLS